MVLVMASRGGSSALVVIVVGVVVVIIIEGNTRRARSAADAVLVVCERLTVPFRALLFHPSVPTMAGRRT